MDTGTVVEPVAAGSKEGIKNYLQSIPVRSLLPLSKSFDTNNSSSAAAPCNNVAWVTSKDTVNVALQTCAFFRVSSCPVWDTEWQKCSGLIDVTDLVSLLVNIADNVQPKYMRSISTDDVLPDANTLDQLKKQWNEQKVEPIMNLCGTNEVTVLMYEESIYDALVLLAQGIHRIPLLSKENTEIIGIISQSLVVNFLYENLDKFGDKPKQLIQQILRNDKIGNVHKVVSVQEDDLVLDAFRKIRDDKISAVSVINEDKKITGVISATDIGLLFRQGQDFSEMNDLIYSRAKTFVELARKHNDITIPPVVSCILTDTLGMAMAKIVENAVHRVFVVQSQKSETFAITGNNLLGVLSLKDILLQFLC
jgi:CBS domain-containing protein